MAGCCSIPRVHTYKELYSFTKQEKVKKGGFASKNKVTLIVDFRGNKVFDEDVVALKESVKKYISAHAGLSEPAKNNLQELRVTEGLTKEEIKLLLGEPDKIIVSGKGFSTGSEIWIYATSKKSTFTIIVLPVYFGHEKYYLYFKDNALALIERHYLEQTFSSTDSGVGLMQNIIKK